MLRLIIGAGLALVGCEGRPAASSDGPPVRAEPAPDARSPVAAADPTTPVKSGPVNAKYLGILEKACTSFMESGCWRLGIIHTKGLLGQPKDPVRALGWFKRGCVKGPEGPGCPERFAAKKALSAQERAAVAKLCGQGRPDACRLSTAPESRYWLCNAGDMKSCRELDPLPKDATKGPKVTPGLPPSASSAARQAAKVCDRGAAFGCATLALGYLNGLYGLPKNNERAEALGLRGCTLSKATVGCFPAAVASLGPPVTEKRTTQALRRASLACANGTMAACTKAAELFERKGTEKANSKAMAFYLRACYLDPKETAACGAFEALVTKAVR